MQTVTSDGLRPATEAERRYTITCIHNATDEYDAKGLVVKVSTKTPDGMYRILEKPDVNVTNAKDKLAMLPVIQKTSEHVINIFRKQASPTASEHVIDDAPLFQKLVILPEPEPAVATAVPNPVPALEKRYAIGSCVFLKRSNGEEILARCERVRCRGGALHGGDRNAWLGADREVPRQRSACGQHVRGVSEQVYRKR